MFDYPPPAPITPITEACLISTSKAYHVPLIIISAIMAQEGGVIGGTSQNRNGTKDHGPMQINTVWLDGLERQGISNSSATNNGCLNVYIGAAILKKHANEAQGDWKKAIGNYHSKTPVHRDDYLAKVAKKIQKILSGEMTITSVLNKANGR